MPNGRALPSSRFKAESVLLVSSFFLIIADMSVGGLRVLALSFASDASRLASASDVSVDNACLTFSDVAERGMLWFLLLEEEEAEAAEPDEDGSCSLFADPSSFFGAGPLTSLISSTVFEPDASQSSSSSSSSRAEL